MNNNYKISNKIRVPFQDIVYLKGDGNYTTYYFENGKYLKVAKTMKKVEASLEASNSFFRSHKSFLVNLGHILAIDEEKLILTNNSLALISRRKKNTLNVKFRIE